MQMVHRPQGQRRVRVRRGIFGPSVTRRSGGLSSVSVLMISGSLNSIGVSSVILLEVCHKLAPPPRNYRRWLSLNYVGIPYARAS